MELYQFVKDKFASNGSIWKKAFYIGNPGAESQRNVTP